MPGVFSWRRTCCERAPNLFCLRLFLALALHGAFPAGALGSPLRRSLVCFVVRPPVVSTERSRGSLFRAARDGRWFALCGPRGRRSAGFARQGRSAACPATSCSRAVRRCFCAERFLAAMASEAVARAIFRSGYLLFCGARRWCPRNERRFSFSSRDVTGYGSRPWQSRSTAIAMSAGWTWWRVASSTVSA